MNPLASSVALSPPASPYHGPPDLHRLNHERSKSVFAATTPPLDSPVDATSSTESLRQLSLSYRHPPTIAKPLTPPTSDNGQRSLLALSRDKLSSALANLTSRPSTSESSLRSISSSGSLHERATRNSRPAPVAVEQVAELPVSRLPSQAQVLPRSGALHKTHPGVTSAIGAPDGEDDHLRIRTSRGDERIQNFPRSVPTSRPGTPTIVPSTKMHQTSSRLLRMTADDRPFTKDFKDLFSTLMVSLPLTAHRVRFQKIDHTFSSEEAITNLGSLKFSQSNRMPDPKDNSRIVTTTTTTTFSMAKEMARAVCQRFLDARFIEPADLKPVPTFPLRGAIWQLSPKGMHILERFCQRNGINQRHVVEVLSSPRNAMQLVTLERDIVTDKLSHDRGTIEVIFRRFAGQGGANVKSNTTASDSDSLSEFYDGLVGVKVAERRKISDKTGERVVYNSFTGRAAADWLMDCCTTVDRRETYEMADLFVQMGLMWPVVEDKAYKSQNPMTSTHFQPTKNAIYTLTDKGQRVAGWIAPEKAAPNGDLYKQDGKASQRDSNTNRMTVILNDAALRLLFREFLRDTHCEENLSFYLDVMEFSANYKSATIDQTVKPRADLIRELLAAAYGLYNAFLAPGSPCELNIDHSLRNALAGRMTRAVGDDEAMSKSLREVADLFDKAQNSVFKLMASDSVPKFLKDPRYAVMLREHDFENAVASAQYNPGPAGSNPRPNPERSTSKGAR
ncbi:MAG: hypothetical protein M1819_003311 [Sarea resinae]|nr:MAG: hypothetical protein M1819_003311 [Sarea resinae]